MTARKPQPQVLIIFGRAGAGKTTCAQYLAARCGLRRASFAAPLKRAAVALWRLPASDLYNQAAKAAACEFWPHITPRQILQQLGDFQRERYGHDFFLRRLALEIVAAGPEAGWIIDDGRYPNETTLARYLPDGWRVVTIGLRRPDLGPADSAAHPSEHGDQVAAEYVVNNDGSLPQLYDMLDALADRLGLPRTQAMAGSPGPRPCRHDRE